MVFAILLGNISRILGRLLKYREMACSIAQNMNFFGVKMKVKTKQR